MWITMPYTEANSGGSYRYQSLLFSSQKPRVQKLIVQSDGGRLPVLVVIFQVLEITCVWNITLLCMSIFQHDRLSMISWANLHPCWYQILGKLLIYLFLTLLVSISDTGITTGIMPMPPEYRPDINWKVHKWEASKVVTHLQIAITNSDTKIIE
jgi:hypothetical protein